VALEVKLLSRRVFSRDDFDENETMMFFSANFSHGDGNASLEFKVCILRAETVA
jgi:hypothetical protein